MKKKVMILRSVFFMSALTVASFYTQAQEQQAITGGDKLTPKFGIKGAASLTSLYTDNVSKEHAKFGFNAGVYAKLPITTGFSIQPELLYSVKGAKDTYSNFVQGDGEYRFNLNYLELPVLAVVNITRNFSIHAGPYVGYLVSANVKNVDNNGEIQGATDLKADDFKRWDVGLAGGVALDVSAFTLGARYNYGLTEIGKSGSLSGDLTKNSKNAGVSVYVGFAF